MLEPVSMSWRFYLISLLFILSVAISRCVIFQLAWLTCRTNVMDVACDLTTAKKNEIHYLTCMLARVSIAENYIKSVLLKVVFKGWLNLHSYAQVLQVMESTFLGLVEEQTRVQHLSFYSCFRTNLYIASYWTTVVEINILMVLRIIFFPLFHH